MEGTPNKHENGGQETNGGVSSLSEMPSYAEHMQKMANAERKQFSPEDMKDASKMIEQMEQMGARAEIVNNPAFRQMVEDKIIYSGLMMSRKTEMTAGEHGFGLSSTCEKGDSRYHDRSNMEITIRDDGSVVIGCACVDRNAALLQKDAFRYNGRFEGATRSDGLVETTMTENIASITEFSATQDGGLHSRERSAFEMQYTEGSGKYGIYSNSTSETVRQFDQNGVEQYREDASYQAQNATGHDFVTPHLGGRDLNGTPRRASFNLLRNPSLASSTVEQRTIYRRNPNGTMHVDDYNHGEWVKVEDCPINTEHGTEKLIPVPGVIEAAHEAVKH